MEYLYLEKPLLKHKSQYEEMIQEWESFGGRLNPGSLNRYSNKQGKNATYEEWLKWTEQDTNKETCPKGSVPQDLYFLLNKEKRILGAISIRKYNGNKEIEIEGHLGIGIRPSERSKGYATKMIGFAIEIIKRNGNKKIIYICDKDNIGSSKAIINNGGIFECEIKQENGIIKQKYYKNIE